MIEIIDQSQINTVDPSIQPIFTFRCSLCGVELRTTTRARAENAHGKCAPGAREAYQVVLAKAAAAVEKARAKAAQPNGVPDAPAEVAAPKRRGRPPKKVAIASEA